MSNLTPAQILADLKDMGYSLYRISKDTGLAERSLSNWYKGKTSPLPVYVKILEDYHKKILLQHLKI